MIIAMHMSVVVRSSPATYCILLSSDLTTQSLFSLLRTPHFHHTSSVTQHKVQIF